jgi:hypothetical protein
LKEETLDNIVWKTHFGRGNGRVIRLQKEWRHSDVTVSLCARCGKSFSKDGHIVKSLGTFLRKETVLFSSLVGVSFFWFCPLNAHQMFKNVEHCFLKIVWRHLDRKSTDDSMWSGGNIFSIVDTVIITERCALKRHCCHLVVLS